MQKTYKAYLIYILFLLAILAGVMFISQMVSVFPINNYIDYWSSGRINSRGGNPYSPEEMFNLLQQIDSTLSDAIMMWNPPWLLGFIMIFGLLNYSMSRNLWSLLELFTSFSSADLLWQVYGGNLKKRWIAGITILCIGPTLHALKLGQITPFILLVIAGFLYFQKKDKPFWAGVMVSMIFLKPHLLYLLAIAVVLWSITWFSTSVQTNGSSSLKRILFAARTP